MFSIKERANHAQYFKIIIQQCGCLSYNFVNELGQEVVPTNLDDYKCSVHLGKEKGTIENPIDRNHLNSTIAELLNLSGYCPDIPFPMNDFIGKFKEVLPKRFSLYGKNNDTLAILRLSRHYNFRPVDYVELMKQVGQICGKQVYVVINRYDMFVKIVG